MPTLFCVKKTGPRIVDLNGSNNDQKQPRRQDQPDKRKHDVKYPFDITYVHFQLLPIISAFPFRQSVFF